jgi:anti-sigma B factor antagonist
MRVREEQVGDVTVLVPEGDLDATVLPAFEARVAELVQAGARLLVWDLAAVGMLPSTAAGFLIQARQRVRAAGGRMVLAGMSDRVAGTLRTMGVLALFRSYPDRAAAIAALVPPEA